MFLLGVYNEKQQELEKGIDSVTDCFLLFVAETDRQTSRDGSRDNDDGV